MLRLENIKKSYVMKDSSVLALKGITLAFRKNEFVSILGPSGCGKTTLLNILGGLDHYSEGNLVIAGKSTKDFSEHDWDIYRNHRIGFIFQSYNLIPHENILENVELALTIAGVSKEEKVKRSMEALDKVGLKDMYKKKPNQLSGGQCQRVAIARALVNEPEILLADEPTGALDSTTSVQIMELIKEISKEKLVIMVTHNPELAKLYSTRIVSLLDGQLKDDTNPYDIEEEKKEDFSKYDISKEKAKMSFWTAFKLSAKNLWSKASRTAMIIVAASIGIVGVSSVLAVSSGVTGYIDSMQNEMLSGNPIRVAESSYSLSNLVSSSSTLSQANTVRNGVKDGYIDVEYMVEELVNSSQTMDSAMITNNITKEYESFIDSMPKENYEAIKKIYGIDVNNNIYTQDIVDNYSDDIENGHEDEESKFYSLSCISSIATSIVKQTDYGSYSSLISQYSSIFSQTLDNEDYILDQYDIVKGSFAKNVDEVMIVLSKDETITDFTLTFLGYFSQKDLTTAIHKFNGDEISKEDEESFENKRKIALDTLMNKEFIYYPNDMIYTKNNGSDSENRPFYYANRPEKEWENNGLKLKVSGILVPKEGRQYSSLSSGFYYTKAFTERYLADNLNSSISNYIKDNATDSSASISSSVISYNGKITKKGIYYDYNFSYEGEPCSGTGLVGSSSSSSSMMSLISIMFGGSDSASQSATLSLRNVGGNDIPSSINFYPISFDEKYLLTDYLDKWNSDEDLIIDGKTLKASDREKIEYTDNLEIIISMITTVIDVVTIALVAFTALSLVVSTVMISIITYVSVMERIKEIGVIRALGGRTKDVSHLFNAETFIIGFSSGVFGIAVTYILEAIVNVIVHSNYTAISMIANLQPVTAIIVIVISVALTLIAGLIPASSAAHKDPVVALRTE